MADVAWRTTMWGTSGGREGSKGVVVPVYRKGEKSMPATSVRICVRG